MKLMAEEQILDIDFRQTVIAEINGSENQARKFEAFRRYECFKDKTAKWVLKSLEADGLTEDTLKQMRSRVSNISICKKIVNKLARTYSAGVQRMTDVPEETKAIDDAARFLKLDDKQKKSDRYRELFRNTVSMIVPQKSGGDDANPLYSIGLRVLGPWEYDVIEDCHNREIPRVFILSDFVEIDGEIEAANETEAGRHTRSSSSMKSDGIDQTIADSPQDKNGGKRKTYIWWSANFHFTTWEDGSICEMMTDRDELGPVLANPIQMLPFAVNAEEQDGSFWADGGEDIVDGSILVNKQITDMFFVQYQQGYGIPVIVGKNLKDRYTIGPNKAILLEYEQDDPEPKVYFASANPPIDNWMRSIEQYVAMLLTTNNLSVTQLAGKLDATQLPSGIALVVERAEVTVETEDKHSQYASMERELFNIFAAWQAVLYETADVDPDLVVAVPRLPEDIASRLVVRFNEAKPVMTESEKLANLKARKELGINEEVDLIMMDNPDMTREDADKKLLAIKEAKMKNAADMAKTMAGVAKPEVPSPGESEDTAGDDQEDSTEDPNADQTGDT